MATTDTRPGFRLPWSAGHQPAPDPAPSAEPESRAAGATGDDSATRQRLAELEAATERAVPASLDRASIEHDGRAPEATMRPALDEPQPAAATLPEAGGDVPAAASRRPTKFLAELTKAMQLAAQAARDETLAQYRTAATSFIEQLHARSSEQAAEYRRRADEDLAAIREWSKAEIARIREETERRVGDRKSGLEEELAAHAARIELAIERVQARVTAYEREMDAFFERLQSLDDPTTFAALAASLPEPPPFEVDLASDELVIPAGPEALPDVTQPAPVEPEAALTAAAVEPESAAGPAEPAEPESAAEPGSATEAGPGPETGPLPTLAGEVRPDPVASPPTGRRSTDFEAFQARIAALGLSPDFAAAEAELAAETALDQEARAAPGPSEEEAGVPVLGDEALAARLASLVPGEPDAYLPAPRSTATTTRVVVAGLASVASIASFKRHLARVPGVQSVGVSSGPDGEFVFSVVHGEEVAIGDAIPALPGFGARVTSTAEGVVHVAARDPETES